MSSFFNFIKNICFVVMIACIAAAILASKAVDQTCKNHGYDYNQINGGKYYDACREIKGRSFFEALKTLTSIDEGEG